MKTYGQYCGLAKALDHVGDRWTLLIVRELLLGPRRYSQIRAALPGIATNLLAERLRNLEADEVVSRADDGAYELTDFGRELEEVIHGLVRWGGRWMTQRAKEESFAPEWLAIALDALLPGGRAARIEIRSEGGVVSLDGPDVVTGTIEAPDAVIEGPPELILGFAVGAVPMSQLTIVGSRRAVGAAFRSR